MPAVTSLPMTPVLDQLTRLSEVGGSDVDLVSLVAVLARVTDPRARRGVRHRLTVMLVIGVCAVLGGMRSFVAIAQWARESIETCPQLCEQLGISRVPTESTIRRTLQRVDPGRVGSAAG
jgi:DDE_Tnp_1-associated